MNARQRTALFLVALLLRGAGLLATRDDASRLLIEPDSREYVTIARNLVAGHGFSSDVSPDYRPDIRRTPVYPALLAVIFRAGGGVRGAAWMGAIIGSLTAVVTAEFALPLIGAGPAAVAGLLLATDATSIAYDDVLLTDALFTLLVVTAVWSLVRRSAFWSRSAAVGGFLCLGLLCRPVGLFLPLAVAPVLFVSAGSRRRGAIDAALVAGLGAIAAGAWIARNALVAGVITFSSIAAVNLYFHRAAAVEARLEGRDVDTVREEWQAREAAADASQSDRLSEIVRRGWSLIGRHPVAYAEVYGDGLVRMFAPDSEAGPQLIGAGEASRAFRRLRNLGWIQLAFAYATAAFGLICLARSDSGRRTSWTVPVLFILYFVLTAGPEAYMRFRVPVMPFVEVLSAAGIAALWRSRTTRAATDTPAG